MATFGRLKNAWNAFMGRDPTYTYMDYGQSSGINPSRPRFTRGNSKSYLKTFYCRIANDCASIDIKHIRLDENDKYLETIDDELNQVLTKEANVDQTGRELIRDIVISMLDEGVVAVVPFETDQDPNNTEAFKVLKARTAKIMEWYPYHIKVEIYNEDTGRKVQMVLEKRICAIIENPFYTIMNEPNLTSQRLSRVNSQLDSTNDQASSGKIDMLIQLPYPIKAAAKRIQAKRRQKELEEQLNGSAYGIGYIDATEKVIQLNRSLDNNLWDQSKDLREQLFSELGFSQAILDGTASEQQMLNYQNNIIEPILTAIVEAMERKWLSKTARTQKQAIRFFKQPFKLVPVNQIADIADKFTRNEIMTSNEMRGVIGMEPIDDPKANELRNANLNHPDEEGTSSKLTEEIVKK